jgi:hypothetical protein
MRAGAPYAWPVVALTLALVFRKPVSRLIDRVRRFRYRSGNRQAELVFDELANDAHIGQQLNVRIRSLTPQQPLPLG